ncbi:DUF2897 family protein [Vibrio sonorensis]|uniref:DUF2897 family protein n=1 Tax=Vibrio sonorensis TaxID=1004316 RepID=UPI0008DAC0B1|nr:DUF2897 family protein [Vibrio sonorensis]
MADFLTNPWVVIVIVISVMIGNLSALKYVINMRSKAMKKAIEAQKKKKEQGKDDWDDDWDKDDWKK